MLFRSESLRLYLGFVKKVVQLPGLPTLQLLLNGELLSAFAAFRLNVRCVLHWTACWAAWWATRWAAAAARRP